MKRVLLAENRMTRKTVEECLKHALAACDHGGVLLRLGLLDRIVRDRLLVGDGWDDKNRVELGERVAERFKL